MSQIKFLSGENEFTLQREAVAHIDTTRCVNCGTCRESCPVDAIKERQRSICRICPECAERSGQSLDEMDAFMTKQSCTTACPVGISPQGYINLFKKGKKQEAYQLIWKKNPLPSVCSYICHHPCEQVCKRGALIDNPIDIRGIKRFLSENVDYHVEKYPRLYEERIAIVGGGPAGLAAGHYLSSLGYETVIYESDSEAGGMLVKGIPEFRLDREAVKQDIERLEEAGLEIHTCARITKYSLKKLQDEYDAVIVAAGLPYSKTLDIPGKLSDGVLTAIQFMQMANYDEEYVHSPANNFDISGDGLIVGGGSVAMDCARTALRLGARSVKVLCMEDEENLPAHKWEADEAREEGVEILPGWCPKEFTNGGGGLYRAVRFAKVTKVEKNEDGKLSFTVDEEPSLEKRADFVIEAIGQKADDFWPDADGETLFYAGDVKGDSNCVIDAIASARKTAFAIDKVIRGRALRNESVEHKIYPSPIDERIFPANRNKLFKHARPVQEIQTRLKNFDPVDLCYSERAALRETSRCLQCGYEEVDPSRCIGCGLCQQLCLAGDAITMVAREK